MATAALQQAVRALENELQAANASVAARAVELAILQTQTQAKERELRAAQAPVEVKRGKLALSQRALREGEDEALKQLVLAPLFPELSSLVFALLPVDSRLRCREVCRGWRAFLADVRFWQVCDLGLRSGVARRSPALLRAASERAHGTLRELDVSDWYRMPVGEGEEALGDEQLLPVLRANAASLLELHAWKRVSDTADTSASAAVIEQLLAAAPRLRLLECDASLIQEEARGPVPRLLREPLFAPLRLRTLYISAYAMQPPPDLQALASWAETHPTLKGLALSIHLDSQPALDALIRLATSKLQSLDLFNCRLSPASLPALTQMLEVRSLTELGLYNGHAPILVGASVPAFCTALRACCLFRLDLSQMCLWESLADGLAVIAACTGHPTLRKIFFMGNKLENAPGRAVIETALHALQASIPGLLLFFH